MLCEHSCIDGSSENIERRYCDLKKIACQYHGQKDNCEVYKNWLQRKVMER